MPYQDAILADPGCVSTESIDQHEVEHYQMQQQFTVWNS